MTAPVIRALAALCLVVGLAACASGPKLPDVFLLRDNELTALEGKRLMQQGQAMVDEADSRIARGKQLIKDGRAQQTEGEELLERGRQALEAATMAEEAETLRRKAAELKPQLYH